MPRKFFHAGFISFFFLTHFSFGQNLLTLEEAIQIGLANNYDIMLARNDAEIAGNNVTWGNAGLLPQLDVNANLVRSRNNTKQELASGETIDRRNAQSEVLNSGVLLSWTIFDGFNTFVSHGKLQELKAIGELDFELTVETTLADIIMDYYEVVRQKQLVRALADEIEISQGRVNTAQARYDVGSGSRLELLRAQVDLNTDKSALFRQEVILANAKITLNEILARASELEFEVVDTIAVLTDLHLETLTGQVQQNNGLLARARRNHHLARLDLKEVRSQWLPTLGLNLGYNYTRSEAGAGFFLSNQNSGFSAGLNASVNLFNGFNTAREQENARLGIGNRELEYRQAQSRIAAELARAFKIYRNGLTLVELERENLEVARKNVEVALERFKVGTITSLELRESQTSLIDTEARLISTQFEVKRAETELLRLSGRLIK